MIFLLFIAALPACPACGRPFMSNDHMGGPCPVCKR